MPYPSDSLDDSELKIWLIRTLEPLCDADPEVMSDYIIALLVHDAVMTPEEWPEFVARELRDFTEDKTEGFVKLLFETLDNKTFSSSMAVEPAHATTAQLQPERLPPTQPRNATMPSGPSIVSSYRPDQQQSSIPQAGPSSPRNGVSGNANGSLPINGEQGASSAANGGGREKCYDYHNKGFCMAGASCPYEHSADSIIPNPAMMFPPSYPFQPNNRGRGRGGPMRGGRPPMMQPNMPLDMPFMPPFPFPPFPFLQPQQSGPPPPNGAFMGSNKPPTDRNGSTLLVLNIPGQHLSTQSITTYFQTFGSVKSVALDRPGNRALVEFETNHQAFKAWKSDDPVWGSRNVRVLWHRPRPGQGGLGLSVLEKNKGLVEKIKADNAPGAAEERLRAQVKEIEEREKRGKKERLMAEQKVLLKRAKEGSQEEKKVLLVRLREVMAELSDLDKVVEDNGDVNMGGEGDEEDGKRRLHKELEKHGMETVESAEQKELMRLSAQLSELKEKASTMGIESTSSSTRYSPYARPSPRGRGRGRGRGGFAGPMRLDNRTRGLLLSGHALDGLVEESWAQIKDYYEGTGGVLQKIESGWKVEYPNREMAERVMTAGTKAAGENAAGISMGWWNPPPAAALGPSVPENEVEMVEEQHRGERDEED